MLLSFKRCAAKLLCVWFFVLSSLWAGVAWGQTLFVCNTSVSARPAPRLYLLDLSRSVAYQPADLDKISKTLRQAHQGGTEVQVWLFPAREGGGLYEVLSSPQELESLAQTFAPGSATHTPLTEVLEEALEHFPDPSAQVEIWSDGLDCPASHQGDKSCFHSEEQRAKQRARQASVLQRLEARPAWRWHHVSGADPGHPLVYRPRQRPRHPRQPQQPPRTDEIPVGYAPLLDDPFGDVVLVGDQGGYRCSGVMLDPWHVLTARHCLPATRVLLRGQSQSQKRAVDIVEVFTPPTAGVDAALLRLQEPQQLSTHVRRQRQEDPPAGMMMHVGYGATEATGRFGFGRKHPLLLSASGWACHPSLADRRGCDPLSEMVLAAQGSDTCDGDSGGPLFEAVILPQGAPGPHGQTLSQTGNLCYWRLVAITSRALQQSRRRCGHGGVYTRVDTLQSWLAPLLRTPYP